MKKGFTLIELLIVVAIIAILAAIAVPNFLEAQVRAKVSRVKNDHRSYATAIETYYVDNNQYPIWQRTGRAGLVGGSDKAIPGDLKTINEFLVTPNPPAQMATIPTFAAPNATYNYMTLTTPISYVTSYFSDPFADSRAATFGYICDQNGWILFSPGPDTDQATNTDLGAPASSPAVETVYTSQVSQPSPLLVTGPSTGTAYTYDPTNGTVSEGDLWRTKQ